MIIIKNKEKNTKRIILLGSTLMVIVVSLLIGYILISSEIKDFRNHLKTFKSTLIQREKSAIKDVVNNLISDIEYEKKSREFEIRKRVKNQTSVALSLIKKIIDKNKTKKENIKNVINAINDITKDNKLEFFIYTNTGQLLQNDKSKLKIGDNFIDLEDINGKKFVKNIVNQSGFVEYLWFVPKSNIISKKISYSIKIENLNIIIGSSEFLSTNYSLNEKILTKIYKEKFNKNDFIFIFDIMSLSSSKEYSKLILEKNIITDERELIAVENILQKSDYSGNIFYEYDDKLVYSAFLFDYKTFISAGVNLNTIKKIIAKETQVSNENLNKKIISLIVNLICIAFVFFIFSYFLAKKIENIFQEYRINLAKSQQLLIQKSKMECMGEMIGNIAHQWRQPLTQLSGVFLDIESAHSYNELDTKYLNIRVNQANDLLEYMSKTIDDFKEFYNPNAKKKKFNLLKSTQSAINIVKPSLKFHHVILETNINESLHVDGFCNEFSQVILNLLSNSRDMAIQRNIKKPKIRIYTEHNESQLSLHVEDNCGGIDAEILDKIFEPYFTKKHNCGSGIGLYMCKLIIENKMKGKISAKNTDFDSSKFTIILYNHNNV